MTINHVTIGPGNLAGKGVYANRDFKTGEVVIRYNLQPLTESDFQNLPATEKIFTHTHNGQIYLYGEPERFVNHSDTPNTIQDLENHSDVATRPISAGEMITTDATQDDV